MRGNGAGKRRKNGGGSGLRTRDLGLRKGYLAEDEMMNKLISKSASKLISKKNHYASLAKAEQCFIEGFTFGASAMLPKVAL